MEIKRRLPSSFKRRVKTTLATLPGTDSIKTQYRHYRMATTPFRMRPDFVIIGAQRAGTSSFYWNLVRHPQIIPTTKKEIHFFDLEEHYSQGTAWYFSRFPLKTHPRFVWAQLTGGVCMTGEATPAYLYRPRVPQHMAQIMPDVKLIVLLRDPVSRAYSNFNMPIRFRYDPAQSFEEAITREMAHLNGRRIDRTTMENQAVQPYLQRGVYVEQLKLWFEYFKRDQFLILDSRDFFVQPLETLRKTAEFLGLKLWKPEKFQSQEKDSHRYPPINPDTRAILAEFYAPYNAELYDLLGHDFGWNNQV